MARDGRDGVGPVWPGMGRMEGEGTCVAGTRRGGPLFVGTVDTGSFLKKSAGQAGAPWTVFHREYESDQQT